MLTLPIFIIIAVKQLLIFKLWKTHTSRVDFFLIFELERNNSF